jgi:hypothetical protein
LGFLVLVLRGIAVTYHIFLVYYKEPPIFKGLCFLTLEIISRILPHFLLVYPLLYFVLPRFIMKSKYVSAFCWTVVLMVFSAYFDGFMIQLVYYLMLPVPSPFSVSVLPRPEFKSMVVVDGIRIAGSMWGGLLVGLWRLVSNQPSIGI